MHGQFGRDCNLDGQCRVEVPELGYTLVGQFANNRLTDKALFTCTDSNYGRITCYIWPSNDGERLVQATFTAGNVLVTIQTTDGAQPAESYCLLQLNQTKVEGPVTGGRLRVTQVETPDFVYVGGVDEDHRLSDGKALISFKTLGNKVYMGSFYQSGRSGAGYLNGRAAYWAGGRLFYE